MGPLVVAVTTVFASLALLIAVLAVACGGDDDSAIPSPSNVGGNGGGGEIGPGEIVAAPSPPSTTAAIPGDWLRAGGADLGYEIRYPATWTHETGGAFRSWDPRKSTSVIFPAGGISIEAAYKPANTIEPSPQGAEAVKFIGMSGWQVLRRYDPAGAAGVAEVHELVLEREGFELTFVATFGPKAAGDELFWQMLSSVQFTQ